MPKKTVRGRKNSDIKREAVELCKETQNCKSVYDQEEFENFGKWNDAREQVSFTRHFRVLSRSCIQE